MATSSTSITVTGHLPANSLGAALMGSDEEGRLRVNALLVQAFLNYESRHPQAEDITSITTRRTPRRSRRSPPAKRPRTAEGEDDSGSPSSSSSTTSTRRRAGRTRQPDLKRSSSSSSSSSSEKPDVQVVQVDHSRDQEDDVKKTLTRTMMTITPVGSTTCDPARSILSEAHAVTRTGLQLKGIRSSSPSCPTSSSSSCSVQHEDDGPRAGWRHSGLPRVGPEAEGTSPRWSVTGGTLPAVAKDLPPPYMQCQPGGVQRREREWWSACIADTTDPPFTRDLCRTACEEGDFVEEALRQVKANGWSPEPDPYRPAPSYPTSPLYSPYWS